MILTYFFFVLLLLRASCLFDKSLIFTGCSGFALSFDGVDDYIQIDKSPCSEKNPFALLTLTYEIWFYMADYKNSYQWIMGQGGDNGVRFMREGKTNNIALVNANGSAECFQSLRCANVPVQKWYYMAASYNGSHFFLVCNGELPEMNVINCTGKGIPGKWDNRMDIGQDHKQAKTRNGYGLFDEMRVWNIHIPLEELNKRRFRTLNYEERKNDSLSFYYSFDEGESYTLKDDALNEKNPRMNGNLGGSAFRLEFSPKWVRSTSPVVSSFCVIEAKFGQYIYPNYIPIFLEENSKLINITQNYQVYNISIIIKNLPNYGQIIVNRKTINEIPYKLSSNSFTYKSPLEHSNNITTYLTYCLVYESESFLCNNFTIKVTKNIVPFLGTAGFCLYFDGIDDYGFSESFNWPAAIYKKGYGGGPITIEWWGLNTDTDFQIDNLLASGSSVFSIGSTEVAGYWCEDHCIGRFQGHTPWVDEYITWDYGWVAGVKGRTTGKMSAYLSKWTHFVFVSDGRDGEFQGIYLDGELFLGYDGTNLNALPADGTNDTAHGIFLGCWPYWNLCFRGFIDEFRIWNKSLTKNEIKENMHKKIIGKPENLYLYYNFNELINGNEIKDMSGNNFTLKLGGCSNQTDIYGIRGYCEGDFEKKTKETAHPSLVWSSPFLDDKIYDIYLLENQNKTFYINSTDLDGDSTSLYILTSLKYGYLIYENKNITDNFRIEANNYYPGRVFSQWKILFIPFKNYAGYPIDNFTYIIDDDYSQSKLATIQIYIECSRGRYLNVSENKCFDCLEGSYNNFTGKNECILCPIGYYQPNNSAFECIKCKNDYTSFSIGSTYCGFEYQGCQFKSDLRNSSFGVVFNVVTLSLIGFFISLIMAKYNRKKYQSIRSMKSITSFNNKAKEEEIEKENKKKQKKSFLDLQEIFSNLFVFCQLLYLSLIIDESKYDNSSIIVIFKSIISITNFDLVQSVLSIISLPEQISKILQSIIYVLIFLYTIFSIIVLMLNNRLNFNEKLSKKQKDILKKCFSIIMSVSEIFFIPISTTFFKIYSCTNETDEKSAFLDAFCEFECWTPFHCIGLAFASILFLGYSYYGLISLPDFQIIKKKNKLHFIQDPLFRQLLLLFKIMIGGISILLIFNKLLMIIFLLSINFIMTAIVFAIKPYGNIIRLNILIRGIFSIASFTCLACLIDLQTTININFLILPLWTGIIIFILIYIIKAPNLLETNQKFNTTNRLKSIEGKGSAGSLDNSNRRNLSKFSGK